MTSSGPSGPGRESIRSARPLNASTAVLTATTRSTPSGSDVRLQRLDVRLQPAQRPPVGGPLLLVVAVALADPGALEQRGQRLGTAPVGGQRIPVLQGGVHAGAERVVRPRRALGWGRPVDVGVAVATRAVRVRAELARGADEQPLRHALEAELLGVAGALPGGPAAGGRPPR